GGMMPLGIREAVAEGLTTGELAWNGPIAEPRGRSAGRGAALSPRRWIERRMKYLPDDVRAILVALAVLGGDASDARIDELATSIAGRPTRSAQLLEGVLATGLASRPEPGWLKLSSRTAKDALIELLDSEGRRSAHAAAATTIAQHGGVLGRADAALHASLGGDRQLAARLAVDAAVSTV